MNQKKYFNLAIILLTLILITGFQSVNHNQSSLNQPKVVVTSKVYKIGVYEFPPYYKISEDGSVSGFYDDVLKLIQQDIQFKYEYVIDTIDNHLTALENNELDFIFGIQNTKELDDSYVFSHTRLSDGCYVLYGNKHFKQLDRPIKLALINGDFNNGLATHFLTSEGVSSEEVRSNSWLESKRLLDDNQVDLIMIPFLQEIDDHKIVYQFSTGPRYIMGNQKTAYLMNLIDSYTEHSKSFQQQFSNLKLRYTDDGELLIRLKNEVILFICLIIGGITLLLIPKFNQLAIRHKIKTRLENQEYLIYYQPIIDPKSNQVEGLEALLRLEHATRGVLSPYYFMDEIIKSNSLKMVSRWIIKKVILDYQIIKRYQTHNTNFNPNFYISINLSSHELEDKQFVEEVKQYICEANLPKHSICLELTEGTKIQNLEQINTSIKSLKEVGVRFAIDDFGVDYSNLNVLDKIRYDFIKVDKNFIDNIQTSDINRAIIDFISNFTNERDISIVFEGVETKEQVEFINKTININSYIQGYYYARPLSLDVIKFYRT